MIIINKVKNWSLMKPHIKLNYYIRTWILNKLLLHTWYPKYLKFQRSWPNDSILESLEDREEDDTFSISEKE
jgi:hypothetical protein